MKILAVVNGKGGVGKSTTCAHIAYRSSESKKKTLVIDLDVQKNVTNAIANKEQLGQQKEISAASLVYNEEPICPIKINEYLHLLPAADNLTLFETDKDVDAYFKLKEKLKVFESNYDLVIIDTPGNLAARVVCSLVAADACVIPVELQDFAIQAITDVIMLIEKIKSRFNQSLIFLGLIGNKYDNTRKKEKEIRENLEKIFPNKIIGIIGNRAAINDAIANRVPVWDFKQHGRRDEKASKEVESTMDNILKKLFPS